jgi:hypothetical protein
MLFDNTASAAATFLPRWRGNRRLHRGVLQFGGEAPDGFLNLALGRHRRFSRSVDQVKGAGQ